MIDRLLRERNLPDVLTMNNGDPVTKDSWQERKRELIDCLSKNLYGYTPPKPGYVRAVSTGTDNFYRFGGKATAELIDIRFDTPGGEFSFPIRAITPNNAEKPPVILLISFGERAPVPVEEILDNGFALVQFHHHTVEHDDNRPADYFGSFRGGLGEKFFGGNPRAKTDCGKVGLWAYAASRVMDYLQTRSDINVNRIAVAGHSRLGKTALWCRAQDERFYIAMANDGNYGGAGLIRGHIGEDVADFIKYGSFDFFCEGWKDFLNVSHDSLPFDQHFLLACQSPGLVYVASADDDRGMDPTSEFLSCCAASPVYEMLGAKGFVHNGKLPQIGEALHGGNIGFHCRSGGHAFLREDWQKFMDFFKNHI